MPNEVWPMNGEADYPDGYGNMHSERWTDQGDFIEYRHYVNGLLREFTIKFPPAQLFPKTVVDVEPGTYKVETK